MNTETTIESIIDFVKVIYPLSIPVVLLEKVSGGKYRCNVYMNKHAISRPSLYGSNVCSSKRAALKEVLCILEEYLLAKLSYEEGKSIATIKWAEAQIKSYELQISSAKRDVDYMTNTVRRLRYLKEKQ